MELYTMPTYMMGETMNSVLLCIKRFIWKRNIFPGGNSRQRWKLGALSLIGALTAAASASSVSAAPADQATIKVLQYNTRGVIRNTKTVDGKPVPDKLTTVDADKLRFLDVLADRLAAERPQVVTLNEVCGNQLAYLRQKLASSYPMTVTFFPDKEKDKKNKHLQS